MGVRLRFIIQHKRVFKSCEEKIMANKSGGKVTPAKRSIESEFVEGGAVPLILGIVNETGAASAEGIGEVQLLKDTDNVRGYVIHVNGAWFVSIGLFQLMAPAGRALAGPGDDRGTRRGGRGAPRASLSAPTGSSAARTHAHAAQNGAESRNKPPSLQDRAFTREHARWIERVVRRRKPTRSSSCRPARHSRPNRSARERRPSHTQQQRRIVAAPWSRSSEQRRAATGEAHDADDDLTKSNGEKRHAQKRTWQRARHAIAGRGAGSPPAAEG